MFSQLWNPLPIILLFLFSLTTTIAQGNDNSDPLADIFPPLTPFINYGDLMITYNSGFILQGAVNSGVEATPNDTSIAPTTISITPFEGYGNPFLPVNRSQLYTLVMIDPDAPSRANPTFSEILHFVQTGLVITTGVGGATKSECFGLTATTPPVVPYRGPAPPVDSGLHRYIFLLFQQPDSTVDLGGFSADNRRSFNVHQFARDNRFGEPLAAAYFQAQNEANDDTAPEGSEDGENDNSSGDEEDNDEEDLVEGPLIIDTVQPTPPHKTGSVTTPLFTEIEYEGTLTHSLSPEMTQEVDGNPVTDSVEYGPPGAIGDWTMTISEDNVLGPATTHISETETPTIPKQTFQRLTESITPTPTPEIGDDSEDDEAPSNSVAGIQEVETKQTPSPSTPSWLDGVGEEDSSSGRGVGFSMTFFMGVVGGVVMVVSMVL